MTLNTFLKGTAIASVFAVLIVPFIVFGNFFFPFITGKAFFFRTIVEIGFAAWLLLTLRDASVRPRKSLMLWSMIGFLAVIGIADIFGMNPWKSFWSNFERMEGYVTLLHLAMYFIVSASVLGTEKLWRRFLESSVLASICISVYGLFQLGGLAVINQGGVRVDATFGNATYLAIYLVFNIFFALILMIKDETVWKRVVLSLATILNVSILYHTATRGSILGLLGGLLLSALLIALFDKKEKKLRIVAASVVGGVVLVVLGFIAIRNTDFVAQSPVLARFVSISWSETKTQARAYIWPMAVEGWKEHPVLGWGQENFNYIFNANYDPRMYSQEQWFDHTHNIVLDWLVAGGALGLLSYLSLFYAALYLLWKKSGNLSFTEKALFTGLGAAYFFHNLFVFDNLVSYTLFMSVLAYIHFAGTRLEKPVGIDASEMDESDMRTMGPLILVALVFAFYFFNYRGIATSSTLIDALRASTVNPIQAEATLTSFKEALSYNTLGHAEVVERIVEASRGMNTGGVSIETRQKFFDLAKKAVDDQLLRYPDDARYEVFAANFYSMYGSVADAEKHAVRAVEFSPRKQSILFQLGSVYLSQKKYDKAAEIFKRAYDLEPKYEEALKYYAASLIYVGKEEEARAAMEKSGLSGAAFDDAFIPAYADLGKWDKVIAIMKSKIIADPKNPQNRMNLVSAYFQSGNKTAAVNTLKEMIILDPAFKTTGEQYIQQIMAQ
jgi:O-antigen ligase